ncbi:TonB-dependent receptor [Gracilimonas mengyeensis]|uniref:Outer membrane receptor for ferrienterochelin and colicins n=1 Tax=Gracilimonas mengyeensis TaxID=1302730 RepID=A0A521FAM3_9BACT|nr:TonB-dependent receptor [Gracilimonas mengyeensis]SMO92701.1 outer membrane receptor for ferrienterochelin and colicins [Gracilimonas mengyeensis]
MNIKTVLSVFIVMGYLSVSAIAQEKTGTVIGTVSSQGEVIVGANVGILSLQKGSATDTEGKFIIKQVPTGNYSLQASALGFEKVTIAVKVKAGQTTEINIEFMKSMLELEQMVVTGTMRKTHVKDSPVKVEVVKAGQLQQGKTSANIMDLIGGVNGLSTQLNCGVCGTNAIRINGVEGPNTAVLIDGMPIMGALASVYGLNGISPSVIDQVEVIKGPQSTLYGTQALGGVVNIITKNPALTPAFSADVYAKSTEEGNVNIAFSPKFGRFEGFISGNLVRLENYFDKNGDSFNDLVKQSRISLFGKGSLLGKNMEQRLNVAAKYYSEDRTGGVEAFKDDMRGSDQVYGESIYTNRFELMTEYRPAGLNEQLRFNGAVTYHKQDSYYGTDWYDAQQGIVFGQATWDQPVGNDFQLLAGSTIRYETYNDNTPATSDGADQRWIPGMFTQAELRAGDFSFLGGLRVDHHSEHGFVTSPRLSTKFSPSELTTFRASAGTGFRVVNVFTEDHAALTGSREVVFNEDLEPEESRSITASLEQIIPFGTNPMTVSLDGFYTHFTNKIIPDYEQDPNLIVYENLDGFSVTRGFSVGLEQNFTALPFRYNASVTIMDVYTQEAGRRQALTYAPEYTGVFGASYDIRSLDISLGYSGNLVGSKRMPDGYVEHFGRDQWSPAYTTHDLKITKEFTNVNSANGVGFEAYLSAENIFNYTQGSPLVDAGNPFGPDFDTIYTWGPILGRTLSIGARLNLR